MTTLQQKITALKALQAASGQGGAWLYSEGGRTSADETFRDAADDLMEVIDELLAEAKEQAACLASMTGQRDFLRAAMHKVAGLAEAEHDCNDDEHEALLGIVAICQEAIR